MKILLLNDNPVVNKLVTLSAQKTSDELTVASSVDEIEEGSYDLIVVDDTLYTENLFEELKSKISFSKSLYICSRDAALVTEFSSTLKKPFLPTDLVELFSTMAKDTKSNVKEEIVDNVPEELDDLEGLDSLDDLESLDDDLGDIEDLGDELGDLDDLSDLDDINLDEEDEELIDESILDNDEAQKVKDLLDETSMDSDDLDLDLDDSLDFDDVAEEHDENDLSLEDDVSLEDDLELEDEAEKELEDDVSLEDDLELEDELEDEPEKELEDDVSLEDDLELEDEAEKELEDDVSLDEVEEEISQEDVDIESQIESAVNELSEEDLASEIDSLDGLTARDLKLAIGEEVDDLSDEVEIIQEPEVDEVEKVEETSDGVEALKNLLVALTDKKVVASMKGMKISINITLGDN